MLWWCPFRRFAVLFAIGAIAVSLDDAAADDAYFRTEIEPLLEQHCLDCHSGSADDVGGGLWLDHARGLQRGGDSGPAIVAHEPDASPLIQALRYETSEMPPSGRLPDGDIAKFERWVREGAADPRAGVPPEAKAVADESATDPGERFWSFEAPAQPPVLSPQEIDRQIRGQLEAQGLTPAPIASPSQQLRRLAYVLTGLPPRESEVRAFLADPSDAHYAALVDRYLNSPAYAEQWGRHWLDVARYADSNGNDFNATLHNAWRYRDYVIESFANDRPFDEFARQQIAGDLFGGDSAEEIRSGVVATGFLSLGPKMLSERDKEKLRMDIVDEQVDTIGRTFAGLTLGCARCHDHKFDPIPQTDYYAVAGIFRSTRTIEGELQQYVSDLNRVDLPVSIERATAWDAYVRREKLLTSRIKTLKDRAAGQSEAAAELARGVVVDNTEATATGEWTTSTHSRQRVGQDYLHNDGRKELASVQFSCELPAGEYEVRLAYNGGASRAGGVPVEIQHADGVAAVRVDQRSKPTIAKLLEPLGRFRFDGEATVTLRTEGTSGYVIADAVQFVSVAELERSVDSEPERPSRHEAELAELEAELKQLRQTAPDPLPVALAVQDAESIADCTLRIRGEPHLEGPPVPRGVLSAVTTVSAPAIPADESGRREFAMWLTSESHPLTSRVMANRVWHHVFGAGLVRTPDNFGRLGERPTHPALLDGLAVGFVRDGWSVKRLIRRLVLTETFRQSSATRTFATASDPENRLLHRANRRPLSAEELRDTFLLVSGQLDRTRPRAPMATFGKLVSQNKASDRPLDLAAATVRSVYEPIVRNELTSIRRVFDFADPDVVVGRRSRTNVPSQALYLLNSPDVRDAAEQIAASLAERDDPADAAYVRLLSRPATPDELARAATFLQSGTLVDLVHALLASTSLRLLE